MEKNLKNFVENPSKMRKILNLNFHEGTKVEGSRTIVMGSNELIQQR